MSSFGTRFDEIFRKFTADLIQAVEGEARRNEANRKLARAQVVPAVLPTRNSRAAARQEVFSVSAK